MLAKSCNDGVGRFVILKRDSTKYLTIKSAQSSNLLPPRHTEPLGEVSIFKSRISTLSSLRDSLANPANS